MIKYTEGKICLTDSRETTKTCKEFRQVIIVQRHPNRCPIQNYESTDIITQGCHLEHATVGICYTLLCVRYLKKYWRNTW